MAHLKIGDTVTLLTNELAWCPGEIVDIDPEGKFVIKTAPTLVTVHGKDLER